MRRPTKKQLAEWSRKLRDSGFHDIEPVEDGALSGGAAGVRVEPERHEEGAEYTRRAESFLHGHRFTDAFERDVWRLHCEGRTIRETADDLGTYKRRVHETLQRLQSLCVVRDVTVEPTTKDFVRWVAKVDAETLYQIAPELIMRLLAARRRTTSGSTRWRKG